MPHTDFSLDPSPCCNRAPRCPKCGKQMMFADSVSGPPGFDIRTFECIACDYVEKVDRNKHDGLD
jgi:hypothetical protein